ncbi:MAG: hypothetical protein JOZ22_04990 [Acidobacteriia bacterium]|nr:hypothetical protein [Terriglobia bacterium]MBV9743985.1 hypothetical protein [Terriglobia bacterium]
MTGADGFYKQAVRRMLKFQAILATAGTMTAVIWHGWSAGAGFAVGAGLSWLSFVGLKRIADSLGATGTKPSAHGAVLLGSRYLILAGVAYVILRFTFISQGALLTGLFVSLGAAVIEVLFELVYARNLVD